MRSSFREENRLSLAVNIGLFAVTAAAFSQVLLNGFTSWDDAVYVTENPFVTTLSWIGVAKIFSTFVSGNFHPLTVLFQAVEYRLFGPAPGPFHGASLLLHLLNTLLVYRLLALLGNRDSTVAVSVAAGRQRLVVAPLVGTLLFALHPMRVESVAWVSDQKDLVASALALGALIAYAGSSGEKKPRGKMLVFLLFVLAMLSKATVLVLPLLLLLVDYLRNALDHRAWREKIPLFCAAAVIGVTAIAARASYQLVLQENSPGLGSTLSTSLYRLLCYYFARTVVPFTNAFPLYPSPSSMTQFGIPATTLLIVVFVVLCGLIALSLRGTRTVLFGALFFLITLLPSLPVQALGFSADRFSYLPSVGLCFIAGAGFQKAWSLLARGPIVAPALLAAVVGVGGILLAVATFRQTQVWRTSVTLWTHALEVYPATPGNEFNRAHAYHHRGLALQKEGALDKAVADFDSAVRLMPARADFLTARGILHEARGETAAALADFTRAIEAGSGGVTPLVERGIIRTTLGAYEDAAVDFNRALEIDPASVAAHLNLGIVFLENGKHEAALSQFTRLLGREPGSAAAYNGRAMALSALGDHRRAGEDLARSVALGYPVAPAFREQVRRQAESQR